MNELINKKLILEAYKFLREKNFSIPNETLDFMKDAAIEKLERLENINSKESYIDQQTKWIKENNVKIGSIVKVLRKTINEEDKFWDNFWIDEGMVAMINYNYEIIDICEQGILLYDNGYDYYFPYFVLEVIK